MRMLVRELRAALEGVPDTALVQVDELGGEHGDESPDVSAVEYEAQFDTLWVRLAWDRSWEPKAPA